MAKWNLFISLLKAFKKEGRSKKITLLVLCLALISTNAFAVNFSPALLKLSVAPTVQYNFDGSELQIPVTVTGTNALLWFFVYTKDQANNIGPVQNGFMGWHYVSKIDTCIYMSPSNNFSIGSNLVRWNGKDNDGKLIPAGDYTYYMWAFDGIGPKTRMTMFFSGYYHSVDFQELDENGNPLNNPIYCNQSQRWTVGSDPMDSTLIETCSIELPSGWGKGDNLWIDPKDFDFVYQGVKNKDSKVAGITKWNWIPNGDAVFVTEFGDNGYSLFNSACDSHSPVIVSDNNYLYTVDQAYHNTDGNADFFIFDFDGVKVAELDMTEWWNHPDDLTGGGQMNGGPNDHNIRNGKVVLNCHCSCTKQMVDPIAWLESGNEEDFYLWTNGNGDHIFDHNDLSTDAKPWVCNDYNTWPYTSNMNQDANLFAQSVTQEGSAVSFGLLAPDGTGVGYLAYAGETAGWKMSTIFVDSGTPFDGLYTDNNTAGSESFDAVEWNTPESRGTWFIGHDSIKGVLTNNAVAVDETPSAFAVTQNSPNPFNPNTTISFSIPETGTVTVDVFNIAGQKVATVASEFMSAGSHSVVWDASGFSAGVYFYTVKSGDFAKTMKMTLLK